MIDDTEVSAGSVTGQPENSSDAVFRIASLTAIGVAGLCVLLLGLRLRYGIDVIDESYYAAGAYRFAVGLHPLLDDLGAHQFAAYLVAPVVWLWLTVRGSLVGVILVLRVAYFAAALTACAVTFAYVRRLVDWRIALVSVVFTLGLAPLLIFAPSYNTVPMIAISIGTSLAGMGLLTKRKPWVFFVSGAVLAVAALAYPTQWVMVAVAIGLVGWQSRTWKTSALMAGGAALAAAAFLVALRGTLSGVADLLTYNRFLSQQNDWVTGGSKLVVLARGAFSETYLAPAAWLILVMVGYLLLRRRVPFWLTVALPLATLVVVHVGGAVGRPTVTAILILLAAAVTGLGSVPDASRRSLTFVLFVGVSASAVFAYSSSTGMFGFGYGAAAVAAPALAVLLNDIRVRAPERMRGPQALLVAVAVGAVMVCGVTALCWSASYPWGPSPVVLHTSGVSAYAGLVGEQGIADSTSQMASDLARSTSAADRFIEYASTPSAYVLTSARPVAPYLWMTQADGTSRARAAFLERWMETPPHRPTAVLVDAGTWNGRASQPHDFLVDFFYRNYAVVISRPGYVILRAR